jgi:type IV pilus assembly protein PilM
MFGLDIGYSSVKVMQINAHGKHNVVGGYGVAGFESQIIKDGVITDPEAIATAIQDLFNKNLVGDITTRRVALAVPAGRAFSRTVQLPKLSRKEMADAVRAEAEQYIPLPIDELYVDHEVINTDENGVEVLVVGTAKKIVDSYIMLARLLGLEVAAIETTIGSGSRLFFEAEASSDTPTVLIDFGSLSSDITVFDSRLVVTSTVPGGGDSFTNLISEKLSVSKQEAHVIKTKYGLGVSKKQEEILDGVSPVLNQIVKEIRRNVRYYEERSSANRKIAASAATRCWSSAGSSR